MEKLNNKIKNGRSELINDAQMVALYGYDATADRLRRLTCDNTGKMNIEATLELDSSGLAKEATLTDGSQIAKATGSEDGTTSGSQKQLRVDGNGRLSVDINSGIPTKTDGTSGHSPATGIGLIGFDSGTANAVHCDSQGALKVKNIASVNVLPANNVNSGITNDPADSVAVGLRARQTITDASTETFLKCNSSGELITSSSGGGGGGSSTYTLEQQSASTGAIQIIGDGNGNQYIDTNGGSKFVVVVQTGDGSGSPEISVEWSDNTSFSVNQVFICNGFSSGLALTSSFPLQAVSRVDFTTLTTQGIFTYDTIPARYARITVRQTSGSSVTYTAKTTLSP